MKKHSSKSHHVQKSVLQKNISEKFHLSSFFSFFLSSQKSQIRNQELTSLPRLFNPHLAMTGRSIMSLCVVFLWVLCSHVSAQTDPGDQTALQAFWGGLTEKGSLDWDVLAPNGMCGQMGVVCVSEKVVQLVAYGLGLAGTITPQLGELTSLTIL